MSEEGQAVERQTAIIAGLRADYEAGLTAEMGRLYNQFVVFIASAQLSLPQVALVLDMVKAETIAQAHATYKGT